METGTQSTNASCLQNIYIKDNYNLQQALQIACDAFKSINISCFSFGFSLEVNTKCNVFCKHLQDQAIFHVQDMKSTNI